MRRIGIISHMRVPPHTPVTLTACSPLLPVAMENDTYSPFHNVLYIEFTGLIPL